MTTVAFPSRVFPGPPGVAMELPEGWEPVHGPGITMAARQLRPGQFSPNVVVTVAPCPADYDVEYSLAQIRAMVGERDGEVSEAFEAALPDATFVGCDATWTDPEVDSILQANLFTVVAPRGASPAAYLVQLTGAVGGEDAETDYETVRGILLSTTLDLGDYSTAEDAAVPQ